MVRMTEQIEWLEAARAAMQIEAEAVLVASRRLDESLCSAAAIITECISRKGKVIVAGIGKSGYVARKIAATLQSTGVPAMFLHPTEAGHGDVGVCQAGDAVIMVSKSGSTSELLEMIAPLRQFDARFIGILGNTKSPLAREMNVTLDASVQREADPAGLTPTASTLVALAVGHALAVALMAARGFGPEQFHRFHPSGQLGHNLRMRVREVMHVNGEVAWVAANDSLKHIVIEMSRRPLGAACVVTSDQLLGLVTDGDVRRALQNHDDIRGLSAADVMTRLPITVGPDELVHDALRLMEDRASQISVLPVVDPQTHACLGLIRIHDIYHQTAGVASRKNAE